MIGAYKGMNMLANYLNKSQPDTDRRKKADDI
jgi:hypothetical protein